VVVVAIDAGVGTAVAGAAVIKSVAVPTVRAVSYAVPAARWAGCKS
jgi:hypothetical protein